MSLIDRILLGFVMGASAALLCCMLVKFVDNISEIAKLDHEAEQARFDREFDIIRLEFP